MTIASHEAQIYVTKLNGIQMLQVQLRIKPRVFLDGAFTHPATHPVWECCKVTLPNDDILYLFPTHIALKSGKSHGKQSPAAVILSCKEIQVSVLNIISNNHHHDKIAAISTPAPLLSQV